MATRDDYRQALENKILGLEHEGYGDFEFTDDEHDSYLDMAVSRLFPAVYARKSQTGLTVASYGTNRFGSVSPSFPDRVFMVEDATELTPLVGWEIRPTSIIKLDTDLVSTVNVYYYDAYSLPTDGSTEAGISAIYTPLIVLGALIEALEAKQDTGLRGDEPPTGTNYQLPLIDRLIGRYERLKEEQAMSLPSVYC